MKNLVAVLCLFVSSQLMMGQVVTLVQDFKVSNTTADVYRPGIAVAQNGGFAVAWGDSRVGSSNRTRGEGNIYGNIFDGSGIPATPNFVIDNVTVSNAYDEFSIYFSSAIFLPNGNLVVSWHVDAKASVIWGGIKSDDVYYSAFSPAGQRLVPGVQLNRAGGLGSGYGTRPFTVFIPPSTFAVFFHYSLNSVNNIGGTLVDASSGNLLGETFIVNDNINDITVRTLPHAASNGTSTVVVWTDFRSDTKGDIYVNRFIGSSRAGADIRVNDDATGTYNQYGRVAMDASGNFFVVWIDTRAYAGGDLFAQRFSADGNRIGANLKLTKSNSNFFEYQPGIAMHSNGNFVVAWTDQAPVKLLTAKFCQFSASGTSMTDILEVTNSPNTMSGQVDVKIGPNGTLYFTWLDGRSGGPYGQVYAKKTTSVLATSIEKESAPISFSLGQNFPNPFNPSTTIRYALPTRSQVKIEILNLLGQRVAELANTQEEAGHHQIEWQAQSGAASGIYFYRIEAVGLGNSERRFVETKKMLLIR